ncbi:MAG: hypothetical protein J6S05_07490 [Bacteroidaceae bacterium]|nr:hypothetical protein [Bacteroidaceae bacterium]
MSANLIDARQTGTFTSGAADIIALVFCDTAADLPAANHFSGFNLFQGTTAEIMTGEKYRINSSGTWELQPAGSSVSLDLTNYYTIPQADSTFTTPAQVDNFLRGYVGYCLPIDFSFFNQIPDNSDLDTLTTVGTYYKNTNVSGLSNLPAGLTTAFKMVVENTSAYDRQKQWIYPITQTPAASIYWRIKTGGGWQPWYKLTGTLA